MNSSARSLFRPTILAVPLLLLGSLSIICGCQTVPATGETRLTLMSTAQEIRIGREADSQIQATMGVYADEELQQYLTDLGLKMARVSERPQLPWSFRVLDDQVVNAFAVPGGFIYVTRGILAYCNNEAELAGILGHEIGHVTAKHTVIKLSRLQLAQLGFGLLGELLPEAEGFGALAGIGMQILFLKFSREDELEADQLGVRYMTHIGENPRRLIDVMEMLEQVSLARGGGRTPEWVSTHPSPGNRRVNLEAIIEPLDESSLTPEDRESYLRRLNGLVYGQNPRQGYTEDSIFLHPELRFRFRFPEGWQINNQRTVLMGMSPDRQAAIGISLPETDDLREAVRNFFSPPEITWEGTRSIDINGNPAEIGEFVLQTDQGLLQGQALFVQYGGRIYEIIGYGVPDGWRRQERQILESMVSFAELTDPQVLAVQPLRLEILAFRRSSTLRQYYEQRGSPASLSELALLNRIDPDEQIDQGQSIKWVSAGRQQFR
jgi:predicted Zn-dependent protease